MFADAVEQVRGHPGVRARSVEPLSAADPDRLSDPTEPVAPVTWKYPPRQKQGAERANLSCPKELVRLVLQELAVEAHIVTDHG